MNIQLGIYRHYKGNQYKVIGFAKHSETLEDMVIYKAQHGDGGTWVRPLSMWENLIEFGGKTVKRFERIDGDVQTDKQHELTEAYRALLSTLNKCEKIDKDKLGKAQRTLIERRIDALKLALDLIKNEQER